ncbi:MAG: TorF family putative porin [Delftia acidovorans]|jgi:uncharacterized protein (TIGR02001 family)|nr:TorF family putative porin [Delftia acidovorans]
MKAMMNRAAAAVLLAAPAVQAAQEAPQPPPAWQWSGNAALVSDYLFRGISQTQRRPALQAGFDASHRSGLYVSVWGSNVSWAAYNHATGVELDLVAGIKGSWANGLAWDAALNAYNFPGARVDGTDVRYHTRELRLGLGYGSFGAALWHGLDRYWFGFFGTDDAGRRTGSRGSTYLELNWNPVIADGLTLNLHAGRQWIRHLSAFDFSDFRVGLTQDLGGFGMAGWSAAAAAVHNTGDRGLWTFRDADGSARRVTGTTLLLTLSKTF